MRWVGTVDGWVGALFHDHYMKPTNRATQPPPQHPVAHRIKPTHAPTHPRTHRAKPTLAPRVRRAKLFFLRELKGKAARLKEIIGSKGKRLAAIKKAKADIAAKAKADKAAAAAAPAAQ